MKKNMPIAHKLALSAAALYAVSSYLPLWKTNYWWVRALDFPRLQLGVFGFTAFLLYLYFFGLRSKLKFMGFVVVASGLALDGYRILPYSPLFPIESLRAKSWDRSQQLTILITNVLQANEDSESLLELIDSRKPDIVLLVETNKRWVDKLRPLDKSYPHQLKLPLENTFGIALYSRLVLIEPRINFLIENDIPSVNTKVKLGSGDVVEIYGVHPRPPRPDNKESTERDAELILVAKQAAKSKLPLLVMGDLNDVAWSHTSRLFQRISRLLDPRVGRGVYPTFPVAVPFFRFPLDYVFHSSSFRLVSMERLPTVGSDHFPLIATFSYEPEKKEEQIAPKPEADDKRKAADTIQEAR